MKRKKENLIDLLQIDKINLKKESQNYKKYKYIRGKKKHRQLTSLMEKNNLIVR